MDVPISASSANDLPTPDQPTSSCTCPTSYSPGEQADLPQASSYASIPAPSWHRDSLSPIISFTEPKPYAHATCRCALLGRDHTRFKTIMANRQNYDVVVDVDNEVRTLLSPNNCDTPQMDIY